MLSAPLQQLSCPQFALDCIANSALLSPADSPTADDISGISMVYSETHFSADSLTVARLPPPSPCMGRCPLGMSSSSPRAPRRAGAPGPRRAFTGPNVELLGCAGLSMSGLMLEGYTAGLVARPWDECWACWAPSKRGTSVPCQTRILGNNLTSLMPVCSSLDEPQLLCLLVPKDLTFSLLTFNRVVHARRPCANTPL